MKRSTIGLLGVLIALGVVAYLVTLKPGETSRTAVAGEPLLRIDSAAVTQIEVRSSTGTVVLEKRGPDWHLRKPVDAAADRNAVASALKHAASLNVKSIVSTNPEKHVLFQVDTAGTTVTVRTGDRSSTFIVGKPSSSFSETYVRAEGSDEVALVDGSIQWSFGKSVRDWRDRSLVTAPTETIRDISYRYGDTTFTLAFRDSVWTVGSQTANATAVQSLLSALSTFQCDDFLESPPSHNVTAQLTFAGHQLSFAYDKHAKKYYVKSDRLPQWTVVESWRADQVLKRRKDLL